MAKYSVSIRRKSDNVVYTIVHRYGKSKKEVINNIWNNELSDKSKKVLFKPTSKDLKRLS
jgi:hypothetical protein